MSTLKTALKKQLHNAERVALLGIGSDLRGDDAAGILVARQLEKECRKTKPPHRLKVFIGSTAPENLTGEIRRFQPSHLIIVDSAEMDRKAGAARLFTPEEASGLSFCTHKLPLKILADYVTQTMGCETMIIGVQPKRLDFGSLPSGEIQRAADRITSLIKEILKDDRNE